MYLKDLIAKIKSFFLPKSSNLIPVSEQIKNNANFSVIFLYPESEFEPILRLFMLYIVCIAAKGFTLSKTKI